MRRTRTQFVYLQTETLPAGAVLERGQAAIPLDDRGFLLGDGVYDAIRSYSGRLFHVEAHLARLQHSLDAVRISVDQVEHLRSVGLELLHRNYLSDCDAVLHIQVTRGTLARFSALPSRPLVPMVCVTATPIESDARAREVGVSVITAPDTRWARCDIKAIGLLPNVLARLAARDQDADEAVFVRDGQVTEGTHTSVFGVRGNVIVTRPADTRILAGITRSVVLGLCSELGITVDLSPLRESELAGLDELFLTCTTGEVVPVVRLNQHPVGNGRPGPTTRRLQDAFREHVAASAKPHPAREPTDGWNREA
jgi:D-alanine transaminase